MRLLRRLAVVAVLAAGASAPATAGAAPAPPQRVENALHTPGPAAVRMAAVGAAQPVTAQIVEVSPSSEGMPGADLIRRLLSWLSQLALWGSLGSILAGATP